MSELFKFLKFLYKYNRTSSKYERILMKSVMYESGNKFFMRWDNAEVIKK